MLAFSGMSLPTRAQASRRVADSGGELFLGGNCYFRQIDSIGISVCIARKITDEEWQQYLLGGLRIAQALGAPPRVSLACFEGDIPDARQRRMLVEHLAEHRLPAMERAAMITDSALVRGALTAFGWLVPKTTLRAFRPVDLGAALDWLSQGAQFDRDLAAEAWREGRRLLGVG